MAAPRIAWYPDDWAKYPVQILPDGSNSEGPRSIKIIIDTVANVPQLVDLRALLQEQVLSNVQSIKIDNADNTDGVTIQSELTGDRLQIGGQSQAYLPFQFTINDQRFIVTTPNTGVLIIWLYNTPKPAAVWSVTASGNTVTVAGTVAVAEADGANVALGAKADAAVTNPALSGSVIAFLKGIASLLASGITATISGNVATTVANGADTALGSTTDAAVTSPATNTTVIAYLRGLLTQAAATIALLPAALGQGTMAQSFRVVIASNQSAVPISAAASAAADGWDATQGAKADAAVSSPGSSGSVIALLKGILTLLGGTQTPSGVSKIVTSAASVNATLAKNAAGYLFRVVGENTVASKRYLHIYNKASAPTVGTDVPVLTVTLMPNGPFEFSFDGLAFATGIAYGISTGVADNDSGAIAAGDIQGFALTYA